MLWKNKSNINLWNLIALNAIVTISLENGEKCHSQFLEEGLPFSSFQWINLVSSIFSCLVLQLRYKYPSAYSSDVNSNYVPLTVHAVPDLGASKGPAAPRQRGPPTMLTCLAIRATYVCHIVIFSEKSLFVDVIIIGQPNSSISLEEYLILWRNDCYT